MTHTLPGADIRGFYAALGIELPQWSSENAMTRCAFDPDAHNRGDRDPSLSISLISGAYNCHACGAKGGAYDAALALGHDPASAMKLLVRYGLAPELEHDHRRRELRPVIAARHANGGPRSLRHREAHFGCQPTSCGGGSANCSIVPT